jgi:hypothetical protein
LRTGRQLGLTALLGMLHVLAQRCEGFPGGRQPGVLQAGCQPSWRFCLVLR